MMKHFKRKEGKIHTMGHIKSGQILRNGQDIKSPHPPTHIGASAAGTSPCLGESGWMGQKEREHLQENHMKVNQGFHH
jgi:hypothetical protein